MAKFRLKLIKFSLLFSFVVFVSQEEFFYLIQNNEKILHLLASEILGQLNVLNFNGIAIQFMHHDDDNNDNV